MCSAAQVQRSQRNHDFLPYNAFHEKGRGATIPTKSRFARIPTVSTIPTKSRFFAIQRFPRFARFARNRSGRISWKSLPGVKSWKRCFRGAPKAARAQNKKDPKRLLQVFCVGGDKRDRTADLLNAIGALSRPTRSRTPPTGQRKHKRKRGCDVF